MEAAGRGTLPSNKACVCPATQSPVYLLYLIYHVGASGSDEHGKSSGPAQWHGPELIGPFRTPLEPCHTRTRGNLITSLAVGLRDAPTPHPGSLDLEGLRVFLSTQLNILCCMKAQVPGRENSILLHGKGFRVPTLGPFLISLSKVG